MTIDTLALRRAEASDLRAVVEVFLGCWRDSYAAVLPDTLVRSMSDDDALALWSRALAREDRDIVAATVGADIVGIVSTGLDPVDSTAGWVHSLYVAPSVQGQGVGRGLLHSATVRLAAVGATHAYLWVFAANQPSLAFYGSQGWSPDGETRVEEQFGETELRLTRALDLDRHVVETAT